MGTHAMPLPLHPAAFAPAGLSLPAALRRSPAARAKSPAAMANTPQSGGPHPGSQPVPAPATNIPAPEPRAHRAPATEAQQAEHEALLRLVQACLGGDQRAWQQLVSGQHRRVYGLCYRFLGDATEAEDVTQDVFFKVYRNLSTFDPGRGGFHTWLTTLTRNLLVDNYRRTRLERATNSLDEPLGTDDDGGATQADRLADTRPGQEDVYRGRQLRARIQAALASVSPELRECVILRDLEDLDYKEIAQVLKIPEGTVKSRISRGRAELAKLLQRIEK